LISIIAIIGSFPRLLDILVFKRKFLEEREAVLRELAAQAQELGMGYE
jgi:hypothetical protein